MVRNVDVAHNLGPQLIVDARFLCEHAILIIQLSLKRRQVTLSFRKIGIAILDLSIVGSDLVGGFVHLFLELSIVVIQGGLSLAPSLCSHTLVCSFLVHAINNIVPEVLQHCPDLLDLALVAIVLGQVN